MPTYLYGLSLAGSAPAPRVAPPGVGGAAVRTIGCGDLVALVSTVSAPVTRSAEHALAHDRVLGSFVDAGATVAAVRFGQVFDSDDACCREIAERSGRVGDLLRGAEGCVEMRVVLRVAEADVVAPAPGPEADRGPGRAYLESLRTTSRRVTSVSVRDAIGPIIRDERVEELDGGAGVTIAHLIRRGDEARYRVAVSTLPGLSSGVVLGPLALYSFAEPR